MNFPRTRTSLRCTLDAAAQEVDVAHPQRDGLTQQPTDTQQQHQRRSRPASLASMSCCAARRYTWRGRACLGNFTPRVGFAAFSRRGNVICVT